MSCWVVVAAAGKGERAGQGQNKVFCKLAGRSVLSRCLDALSASEQFDGAVLVLSDADADAYEKLCAREGRHALVKRIASGGATRTQSVYNGLCALPEDAEIVAIHDAARPFVSKEVIKATINAARIYGSGVISTPVTDTIKQINPADGGVLTLERGTLRAVQTPQTFRVREICYAYEQALLNRTEATDDAALYETYIGGVRLVAAEGAEDNVKLTAKADFDHFSGKAPSMRIGSGYDAHRLKEGRKLVLCGVEIPHTRGLDGHSDADVAVHALMDALLGAVGEGDIGRHFPDSDEAYRGISSMLLLEHTMQILHKHGCRVGNVDITIVAQRPKLASYMSAMRENVAAVLKTELSRVNIKATTTEKMGFEGEEQGISAQAVALLECGYE